jgi:hypothetical protein
MAAMKKSRPAANAAAYVAALDGWQAKCVRRLRFVVRASAKLDEQIKWGNLVYFSNGPVLVIRAEPKRVLFGFWRGQRLREIEPRLKPGGKYEMATLELHEDTEVSLAVVRRLAKAAVTLNRKGGDPTLAAKPVRKAR